MLRFLLLTGAIFLAADCAFAEAPDPGRCQQIRDAVAQYGYAAARRHALANYGAEAVRTGDQCFARHSAKRYRTYYGSRYKRNNGAPSWQ